MGGCNTDTLPDPPCCDGVNECSPRSLFFSTPNPFAALAESSNDLLPSVDKPTTLPLLITDDDCPYVIQPTATINEASPSFEAGPCHNGPSFLPCIAQDDDPLIHDSSDAATDGKSAHDSHNTYEWSVDDLNSMFSSLNSLDPRAERLPFLLPPVAAPSRGSRSRKRFQFKLRTCRLANRFIDHVNTMIYHSRGGRAPPVCHVALSNTEAPVRTSLLSIVQHARRFVFARTQTPQKSANEMLEMLLKQPYDTYMHTTVRSTNYVDMEALAMDEPSLEAEAIPMIDVMSRCDASFYVDESKVLEKGGKDKQVIKDLESKYGRIGGPRPEYIKYLQRDDVEHLYEYSLKSRVKSNVGIVVVTKSKPDPTTICGFRQRKILPLCAQGYIFGPPTRGHDLGLWGVSALCRVFVKRPPMNVSTFDLDNFFTYLEVPEWMRAYQALPPVRRWELGSKAYRAKALPGGPNTLLFPLYCRLGMGSTHSADVVMAILRFIFSTITMRDQLLLPKAEMLWINWPSDPDILFIAWEIFAGSAVWSAALECFSISDHLPSDWPRDTDVVLKWHLLTPYDSLIHKSMDLIDPHVRSFARSVLLTGRVIFLHSGCPCSPFSVAQTPSIRSDEHPEGLPWNSSSARLKCEVGNALLDASLEYESINYSLENQCGHENSATSFQFIMPSFIRFQYQWQVFVLVCHYCAYGALWMKATGLAVRIHQLRGLMERKCSRDHTHLPLRGLTVDQNGRTVWKTSLASRYPDEWLQCYCLGLTLWAVQEVLYRQRRDNGLPATINLSSLRRSNRKGSAGDETVKLNLSAPIGTQTLPSDSLFQGMGADKYTGHPTRAAQPSHINHDNDIKLPVDLLQDVVILNRDHIPGSRLALKGNRMALYNHIDDCILIGDHTSPTKAASTQAANVLRAVGFVIPIIHHNEEVKKFVGVRPDLKRAGWRPTPEKLALLDGSLEWAEAQHSAPGLLILKILSHWLWYSLLRRASISIPFYIFKFCRKYLHDPRPKTIWPSVHREIAHMRSSLPFLCATVTDPYLSVIGGSDATGYEEELGFAGYGVGVMKADENVVQAVGLEQRHVGKEGLAASYLPQLGRRVLGPDVPMSDVVPASWVEPSKWTTLKSGWFYKRQHIDAYEMRAVLKLYEWLCTKPSSHAVRFIHLVDNSAVAAILARGRAKVARLNVFCQKRYGLELLSSIKLNAALVGTRFQPMDAASRVFTD